MRFTELDAVTVDAYGTLVELVDPVPALREGLQALGVDRDTAAVGRAFAKEVEYYRERFELLPGAAEAVDALHARGLAVAVISNWDVGLGDHIHRLGFPDLPVVTSAEAGAPKPDPAVFSCALERLRVRPERTLHVGDSEGDEAGARAAGMHFAPAPLATAVEGLA